ncbi:hypothetical protein HMN09_01416500 [Mycena chlorophos]|uniref:Uncharacterized protein n=1 Tax=Mycena chlorophos TaxID=658473 RepID=A0A8H6RXI5_MYCCL|nr:hypothetical protein HMN09_01416500 [Mycena chlorophos]
MSDDSDPSDNETHNSPTAAAPKVHFGHKISKGRARALKAGVDLGAARKHSEGDFKGPAFGGSPSPYLSLSERKEGYLAEVVAGRDPLGYTYGRNGRKSIPWRLDFLSSAPAPDSDEFARLDQPPENEEERVLKSEKRLQLLAKAKRWFSRQGTSTGGAKNIFKPIVDKLRKQDQPAPHRSAEYQFFLSHPEHKDRVPLPSAANPNPTRKSFISTLNELARKMPSTTRCTEEALKKYHDGFEEDELLVTDEAQQEARDNLPACASLFTAREFTTPEISDPKKRYTLQFKSLLSGLRDGQPDYEDFRKSFPDLHRQNIRNWGKHVQNIHDIELTEMSKDGERDEGEASHGPATSRPRATKTRRRKALSRSLMRVRGDEPDKGSSSHRKSRSKLKGSGKKAKGSEESREGLTWVMKPVEDQRWESGELKQWLLSLQGGGSGWKEAVNTLFEFESSFSFQTPEAKRPTTVFATSGRPSAVEWWVGGARTGSPPIPNVTQFGQSVKEWWRKINPAWRRGQPDEALLKRSSKDWTNGESLGGKAKESQEWRDVLDDVCWAIGEITRSLLFRIEKQYDNAPEQMEGGIIMDKFVVPVAEVVDYRFFETGIVPADLESAAAASFEELLVAYIPLLVHLKLFNTPIRILILLPILLPCDFLRAAIPSLRVAIPFRSRPTGVVTPFRCLNPSPTHASVVLSPPFLPCIRAAATASP